MGLAPAYASENAGQMLYLNYTLHHEEMIATEGGMAALGAYMAISTLNSMEGAP